MNLMSMSNQDLECNDDDHNEDDHDAGEEEDDAGEEEDDGEGGGESVSPQRLCEFCHTTIQLPSHMMRGCGR